VQKTLSGHASWQQLLASPPPGAHVAHWYDDDAFLVEAVAHYAAAGLSGGEAVGLCGTRQHLDAIRRRLRHLDVDADGAVTRGQLTVADCEEMISKIAPDDMFDAAAFETGWREILEATQADSRFSGIRWWGETADRMFARDAKAAVRMEQIAEKVARDHGARLFCSVACDRFDARAYDGVVIDVCRTHTHLIPAPDYAAHRLTVNRAIAEVVGDISGSLLQSLATWRGHRCELPSSQALLFWLRDAVPDKFRAVLERARQYDSGNDARAAPESAP